MVDQFRSPLGSPDRVLLLSAVSLPFLSTTTAFAMNLVIFLTLVGYTYATIYDKVIPGYYARGIQYVGQFNAETCFVYCDQVSLLISKHVRIVGDFKITLLAK